MDPEDPDIKGPDPKGYGIKCSDKKRSGHGRPRRNTKSAH